MGRTMTEAAVSFAGNLTDDPELRRTEGGIARAVFRVAVSGRRDQEASFFTVVVWRDQAEHAAQSLAKGSRVVVVGRLSSEHGPLRTAAPAPSWRSSATTWRRSATRPATRSRPGSPTRSPRWSSASGSRTSSKLTPKASLVFSVPSAAHPARS